MPITLIALLAFAPEFAARGSDLGVVSGGEFEAIYIKAVNLGSGIPGRFGSEHAIDEATYTRWFGQMTEAGFNAVRVFDLQSPSMYVALANFNRGRREPLLLLQGVWLDDGPSDDLFEHTAVFDRDIANAIDAIHGRADIGKRPGRAHGRYRADVSATTLGWIIGRELRPAEVAATDRAHPEDSAFTGRFFSIRSGTATERWLAERFDRATAHEASVHRTSRPIASVSWPPLDPLHHVSARHRQPGSTGPVGLDDVSVDITRIQTTADAAGMFAAYSVYPYYPEFISREPSHASARDGSGRNPYLGYLKRLKRHYRDRPLLVAEYGVPSSSAPVAREPVTSMNFGGGDELAQGEANARMTANIAAAGCAGGALFSWTDEWWKSTWILANKSEAARLPLWHDTVSPEQNFGLLAFDAPEPALESVGGGLSVVATMRGLRLRVPATATRLELDVDGAVGFDYQIAIGPKGAALKRRGATGYEHWTWQTRERSFDDAGNLRPAVRERAGRLVVATVSSDERDIVVPYSLLGFDDPSQLSRRGRKSPGIKMRVETPSGAAIARRYAWSPWNHVRATRDRPKASLAAVSAAFAVLDQTERMRSRRTSARTSATGSLWSSRSLSSSRSTPMDASPRAAQRRTPGSGSPSAAAMSLANSRSPRAMRTSRASTRSDAVNAAVASFATTEMAAALSR